MSFTCENSSILLPHLSFLASQSVHFPIDVYQCCIYSVSLDHEFQDHEVSVEVDRQHFVIPISI